MKNSDFLRIVADANRMTGVLRPDCKTSLDKYADLLENEAAVKEAEECTDHRK